ncbi:UbiA family prenyltransferase [Colwelliaceae bacterium 6471]
MKYNNQSSAASFNAYLKLIRAPGVFSILSNTLGSYGIYLQLNAGVSVQVAQYILLLLISLCCYQFGMITNDIADFKEDQRDRPFRPLPSQLISCKTAIILALVWAATALQIAYLYSSTLFIATSALIISILTYNFVTKSNVIGPYNMGVVRLLNWLLVLALFDDFEMSLLVIALIIMLYTSMITIISRHETTYFPMDSKPYLFVLIAIQVFGCFYLYVAEINIGYAIIAVFAFFIWLGNDVRRFNQDKSGDVQQWVTKLLKSMVLLDALFLFAFNQWVIGIICLSFLYFSGKLAKYVYLT